MSSHLASGRNYKPGDQISYYIKATPKKVPAYEAAKLASEFDPQNRDENVDYYVAKLDDLTKKFSGLTAVAAAPKQESPGALAEIMMAQFGNSQVTAGHSIDDAVLRIDATSPVALERVF